MVHRTLLLFAIAAWLGTGCGRLDKPVKSASEIWSERLTRIEAGMTRAEVEELFPRHQQAPSTRRLQGEKQIITYWLDDQWKVTLEYDLTGAEGDGTYDSPRNKLLSKPALERHYL